MVEAAFIRIHSPNGYLIVMEGGYVKLRERFLEGICCEQLNGYTIEIGDDGLLTSPVRLF
jgi:hypothetical protein